MRHACRRDSHSTAQQKKAASRHSHTDTSWLQLKLNQIYAPLNTRPVQFSRAFSCLAQLCMCVCAIHPLCAAQFIVIFMVLCWAEIFPPQQRCCFCRQNSDDDLYRTRVLWATLSLLASACSYLNKTHTHWEMRLLVRRARGHLARNAHFSTRLNPTLHVAPAEERFFTRFNLKISRWLVVGAAWQMPLLLIGKI